MLTHETGIEHVQGKLESFYGSRGSLIATVDFGGTAQVVRSGSGRCVVKFFLFPVDGSPPRSRRELARASSKKNYVGRLATEARNGFHSLGSRRAHIHRTFLGNGNLVRRVLYNVARRPGSLRGQTKVLVGDFCHGKINLRVLSCA